MILTKEIFCWQCDTCCYLTKDKLVYKKTVKELSPQITISAWGIIRGVNEVQKKYNTEI